MEGLTINFSCFPQEGLPTPSSPHVEVDLEETCREAASTFFQDGVRKVGTPGTTAQVDFVLALPAKKGVVNAGAEDSDGQSTSRSLGRHHQRKNIQQNLSIETETLV